MTRLTDGPTVSTVRDSGPVIRTRLVAGQTFFESLKVLKDREFDIIAIAGANHPSMAEVVEKRASEVLHKYAAQAGNTARGFIAGPEHQDPRKSYVELPAGGIQLHQSSELERTRLRCQKPGHFRRHHRGQNDAANAVGSEVHFLGTPICDVL